MDESRLEGMLNGSASPNGHKVVSKIESQAATLHRDWATDPRWSGIERTYSAADVVRHPLVQRIVDAYGHFRNPINGGSS